jgi:hypothetical protein
LGDDGLAYQAGLNAVVALRQAGKPHKAISRIMKLEQWPPPLPRYGFDAKLEAFRLLIEYAPELAALSRRIEELDRMVAMNPSLPQSDALGAAQTLASMRGHYAESLSLAERIWAIRSKDHSNHKHNCLYHCFFYCLQLGRRDGAPSWLLLLEQEGELECPGYRVDLHDARFDLALFDGNPDLATRHCREYQWAASQTQYAGWSEDGFINWTRAVLIDPASGDPGSSGHAAIGFLRTKIEGNRTWSNKFTRRLLALDVRLAALRWAVGMPPAEDYWYRAPQQMTYEPRVPHAEVERRIGKVRAALGRAGRLANYLDGIFECDWRRRSVDDRQGRLREIVDRIGR